MVTRPKATRVHDFRRAVRYKVTQTSMTGAERKALAGKDAQYQLYLEEQGDHPDKQIRDDEAVAVRNDMHFYAIRPRRSARMSAGFSHGHS